MLAIIDYGVGNLFSLKSSLKAVGVEAVVTNNPEEIRKADRLILPGVGAFGDAAKKLFDSGLCGVITEKVERGTPLMGICLGMQLLFEKSYEYGEHQGLGFLKGKVIGMENTIPEGLKIPHIGWNALRFTKENPIYKYINEGDCVYFVHSFYAVDCEDSLIATTEYGKDLTAAVGKGNVYGCQFHPEKSGNVGLKILKAFSEV